MFGTMMTSSLQSGVEETRALGGITNTGAREASEAPRCNVLWSSSLMKNSLTSVQGVLELGACVPNMETFLVDGVVRVKLDDNGITS